MSEFVEEIPALVVDSLMLFGDLKPRLLPVVAPLHFATEVALEPRQPMLALDEMSGVGYDRAIGEGRIVFQPNIYPNLTALMLDLLGFDFTGEYRIPLAGVIPLNSQSLHLPLRGAVQYDRDVPDFGAVEPPVGRELESRLRVGDAPHTAFEAGKPLFFSTSLDSAVEVLERLIHSVRNVLEDLGKHLWMFTPKMLVEPKLTNTILRGFVGVDIQFKKLIIHTLAGVECLVESVLLNPARIQPILIHSQLHTNLLNKEEYICT